MIGGWVEEGARTLRASSRARQPSHGKPCVNFNEGRVVQQRFGALFAKSPAGAGAKATVGVGPTPSEHVEDLLGLAREAAATHNKVESTTAAPKGEPGQRVIHPHQIVQRLAWWYGAGFRALRLLEA